MDSDEESQPGQVIHSYISCDECGIDRLRGVRYKSTLIPDFDICEDCYRENHKDLTLESSFEAIRENRWVDEDDYFEDPVELILSGDGAWGSLARLIQDKPNAQKVNLYLDEGCDVSKEVCRMVSVNLAASFNLKTFFVEIPTLDSEEEEQRELPLAPAVEALLEGLADNLSIITLYIGFNFSNAITEKVAGMIRKNKSIRYMFLRHRFDRSERGNQEAIHLFRALKDSSLHSFVCQGVEGLGGDCFRAAVHAMRTKPGLKRIKADFQYNAQELEQLMEEKKLGWMRGWNDPFATSSSRVLILEEVLGCLRAHEQDQVAALFHFLRNNPTSLPQTAVTL